MALDPKADKTNPNPGTGPTGAGATDPSNSPRASQPSAAAGKSAPSGKYAKASESGDPIVHQLLAQRDILQSNREAVAPTDEKRDRERAEIDRQLAEVTRQLNELGFE